MAHGSLQVGLFQLPIPVCEGRELRFAHHALDLAANKTATMFNERLQAQAALGERGERVPLSPRSALPAH
jgi:hypothetical protein